MKNTHKDTITDFLGCAAVIALIIFFWCTTPA